MILLISLYKTHWKLCKSSVSQKIKKKKQPNKNNENWRILFESAHYLLGHLFIIIHKAIYLSSSLA